MRQLAGIASILALAACSSTGGEANSDRGDAGPSVTRSFDMRDFDGVALMGSDDVRVVKGDTFAVVATGTAQELDRLDIRVENGTLKIGRKNGSWSASWSRKRQGIVVTVTMPVVARAKLAGSGDMDVATVRNRSFEANVAGSGRLAIGDIQADNAAISLAGSGDIGATGMVKTLDISVAGSGDVDASALASEALSVSVAGSGDVRARSRGKANVSIIGSGDVTIAGTRDCAISKTGSGDVTCVG
jgi:hypothetical protein